MPYRYHCHACAATGRRHGSRPDAKTERTEHRERAHHGLAPEDEIVHESGWVALGARWLLDRMSARR